MQGAPPLGTPKTFVGPKLRFGQVWEQETTKKAFLHQIGGESLVAWCSV